MVTLDVEVIGRHGTHRTDEKIKVRLERVGREFIWVSGDRSTQKGKFREIQNILFHGLNNT